MIVRGGDPSDAHACAGIYAPYVEETAISFEAIPPSASEMGQRIAEAIDTHAWLVLEDGGRVAGYAYGGPLNRRAAYRWSCEVSVYAERGRRRTGAGRALYEALFERLTQRGFCMAVAGMTLPNEASVGLHESMGFVPVGVYKRVAWKFGSWHDVGWWQLQLVEPSVDAPAELGPPARLDFQEKPQ